MYADRIRLFGVDSVALAGCEDSLPTLALELLVHGGLCILFREHLRQDAVAQSELGILEAGQVEAFEQLGVDVGAGDDDLAPLRAYAGNAAALLGVHRGQFGGQTAYVARRCQGFGFGYARARL